MLKYNSQKHETANAQSTTVYIVQIPDGFNLSMTFIRFTSGLIRPSTEGHDPAKHRTMRYVYSLSVWLIQKYLMFFWELAT